MWFFREKNTLYTNYIQWYRLPKQSCLFSKQVKENKFTYFSTVQRKYMSSGAAMYSNILSKLHEFSRSGLPNLFVVQATSTKSGLYAGNMKFNTHLDCISIHIIIYTFICISFYTLYNKNILIIIWKIYKKNANHNVFTILYTVA